MEPNAPQPQQARPPPLQTNFGVSLLKRPPQQQQPQQEQPMELTARPPRQVMRLVGFGSPRSHDSPVAVPASGKTYIAISRPAPTAAAAASVAKVPHTLYRAATL